MGTTRLFIPQSSMYFCPPDTFWKQPAFVDMSSDALQYCVNYSSHYSRIFRWVSSLTRIRQMAKPPAMTASDASH